MDEKITKLENLAKEIETEKDFDRCVEKFNQAAGLIKLALADGKKQRGKVLEVIKEVDGFLEREINVGEDS